MPRNGSGTYSLPANSWNPAVTGTTIESSANNATMTDLASALTQSLSKDGQTVPTADIQLGGYKLTNVGDGTTATDAATYGQTLRNTGNQTLSGNLTVNGSVSLSGSLTVTGPVIFSSGTISVGTLTVTSVASIASVNVTGAANLNVLNVSSTASLGGTTNANVLNVASVASLNRLTVSSVASLGGVAIASGLVVGAASGGNLGPGTINVASAIYVNGQLSTGKIVQQVHTVTGATASGSNTGPSQNDTIPTTSNGTQFMSQAITPTNASNLLRVDVTFCGSISAISSNGFMAVWLTLNAETDARATAGLSPAVANRTDTISFTYWMTAGSTSAMTFRVYAAGRIDSGASITTYFNGTSSGRIWGGTQPSGITITEYSA